MKLRQLIYGSAASHEMGENELQSLLEKARVNNAAVSVSGMLLYHKGSFLQVLEGPWTQVKKIEERIRRDKRHGHIVTISDTEVEEREFGEWSMGFVCGQSEKLHGFTSFLSHGKLLPLHEKGRASRIIRKFKEGLWRQAIQ